MTEELEKEGKIKRTTINEPRLSKIVSEYKSLGYEVHLEPVKIENLAAECVIEARVPNSRRFMYKKASDSQFLFSSKINWVF
jgi:hypothetical protein